MNDIPYFTGEIHLSWILPNSIHIINYAQQQDYYGTFKYDKDGSASGNITSIYYQGSYFSSAYPPIIH